MIYLIVLCILVLGMVITLMRASLGPTLWDRVLAINAFSTQVLLLIAVYFFASGHPEYIDIALLYALLNYIGTLALVKFFNRQSGPVDS